MGFILGGCTASNSVWSWEMQQENWIVLIKNHALSCFSSSYMLGINFITANVIIYLSEGKQWICCKTPAGWEQLLMVRCSALLSCWELEWGALSKTLACSIPVTWNYTPASSGTDTWQLCLRTQIYTQPFWGQGCYLWKSWTLGQTWL